jgi:tetratricopeptide (TPR) repeat protein
VLAIEHYRRAIELDESFVLAWLALANAYLFGAQNVPAQSVAWRQAWLDAIERARAIAPDHPGVLGWDALRSAERGSWREAAVFLQERPPELRAGYGSSIQETVAQGNFLMIVGRSTEAISFLERARTLEPLDPGIALFLGDAYANVGAFPQALAEFDRGVQLESLVDVLHGFAAFTALASGDRATAERHLAAFSDPRATGGSTMRSMARFLDDPATGAAEVRRLLNAESFQDFVTPNILAHWAAYYGDADTALALLRGIPAEGNSQQLAHSLWRTVFRDMRKLPGFKDFVSDLGLVAYWREFGWSDFCRPVGDDDFECE